VRVSGGEWHDVKETVRIVRIPCRFGGSRPYFACPGVVKRLGVEFVSLIEAIGTTTPMSSFIFNIKAVLAELERSSNQRMHPRWAYRQRIEPIASGMQCVWCRSDNKRVWLCMFALEISDWKDLGRTRLRPVRGCCGTTRCRLGQHRRMQRDT
jgi:hypothetical protein